MATLRRLSTIMGMMTFAFFGGAVAQTVGGAYIGAALATALSSWIGQAGVSIPTWVSGYYGFNGTETTSPAVTPFFSVSPNGRWAGIFAARTSDNAGTGYTSGLNQLYVYDDTGTARPIWGQYMQGIFNATAKSGAQLIGVENSISNQKTAVTSSDPFALNHGDDTINYRSDCGVGVSGPSPKVNCTSALQIINNGAKYASPPIIIGSDAVDIGIFPNPPTIAMPVQDAIAWYTSAGVLGARMFAGAGSPAGTVSCADRCLYLRTDGGAGTTLYVNETGGGTSGWAAK